MTNCDHEKVIMTVDDDGEKKRVCPICDDVQVQTLDDS
jgi:hypothetical protein